MIKKNLWIVALLAAVAVVFMGCPDTWGDLKNPKPEEPPGETITISDPDEIGGLLSKKGWNGNAGADVSTDKNVAIFNISTGGSSDNQGFEIKFPEEVAGQVALEVTFKLTEVTTLTGGAAKIGFKSNISPTEDVTPYDDYEIVFGNTAGVEFTQAFPLSSPNKLPNKAVYFSHNKYGDGAKKGADPTQGDVKYKLEITKIVFVGGDVYAAVQAINNVPAKAIKLMPTALPTNASPDTANFTDVVWTVKAAGTTGATLAGNVLSTTATGTVTVTGTVVKGASETTDFVKDFDIAITEPNGILITDFSAGTPGADTTWDATKKAWTSTTTYKKVDFGFPGGVTLTASPAQYQTITIVYSCDVDVRFAVKKEGTGGGDNGQVTNTLSGGSLGDWDGFWDLTKTEGSIVSKTITIPNIADFDGFMIGNKGVAPATWSITAIYFEKKGLCDDCGSDPCFCYIPVTSIANVPVGSFIGLDITLPDNAFPTYASNTAITWEVIHAGGTGVSPIINSNKLTGPTNKAGKIKIRGTVIDGVAKGTDFVKDFELAIGAFPAAYNMTLDVPTGINVNFPGQPGNDSQNAAMTKSGSNLVFTYSADTTTGFIKFTDAQIETLKEVRKYGGKIIVNITGTQTADAGTFRSCVGDVTLGSGWNATTWIGGGAGLTFSGITGYTTAMTLNNDNLKHLIIQCQSVAGGNPAISISQVAISFAP